MTLLLISNNGSFHSIIILQPNKNDGNSKAEDDCCQRTNASTRSIWEDQDSTFSPWSTQSSRTTQYTYSPYFNDIQNLLYSKPATYW